MKATDYTIGDRVTVTENQDDHGGIWALGHFQPFQSRRSTTSSKDPAAVSLGRRGGLKGGRARAEALSPERRKEIARKAAAARWGKKDA